MFTTMIWIMITIFVLTCFGVFRNEQRKRKRLRQRIERQIIEIEKLRNEFAKIIEKSKSVD